MALTKTSTAAWDTVSLVANANTVYSNVINVAGSYHTIACIKLVNGATGPTVAATCNVEIAVDETNDANASNFTYYFLASGFSCGVATNGGASWVVEVPLSAERVRFSAGDNTDQNVTVEAWVVTTTALN